MRYISQTLQSETAFMLVHMVSMSACLMQVIPSGDSKKLTNVSALMEGSFSLIIAHHNPFDMLLESQNFQKILFY